MADAETLMAGVPTRDPHFVLGVMARIEQRRFRRELARTGLASGTAIILLALVMPKLEPVLSDSFAPLLNNGVIATVMLALTFGLPRLLAAVRNG